MAGELLLDTGALVSLLDRSQTRHEACRLFFEEWTGPVVSTEAVLTEATHLLASVDRGMTAALDFFLEGGAVIVPSSYRVDDGVDPAPAAAAVMVRVAAARLCGGGLHVDGAAVTLEEADGRPVSRFSTYDLDLARGQSARRVADCDVRAAFAATPGETSTPGAP